MQLRSSKAKRQLTTVEVTLTLFVSEKETLERMVEISQQESGDESNDVHFLVSDFIQQRIEEFEAEELKKQKEIERAAKEAKEKEERDRLAATAMPTERSRRGERAA